MEFLFCRECGECNTRKGNKPHTWFCVFETPDARKGESIATNPDTKMFRQLRAVIGGNIRKYRTARRLTLQRLSRLTDIPANKLDRYELGKDELTLWNAVKIAHVLEKDFSGLPAG